MNSRFEKLSQLCDRAVEAFQPKNWPSDTFIYIDVSSVDAGQKAIVAHKRLEVAAAPSRAQQVLKAGDILISTVRPNLNAVARVSEVHEGAVCSSAFTVLRCGPDFLPDYLFCLVQAPEFVQRLVSLAQGSHYPAVTDKHVFSTDVLLLSIEQQKAIAIRILDSLTLARRAAALIEEQIALTAEALARLLSAAFEAVLPVFAGGATGPSPAGWNWQLLRNLARLESGHTPSRRHPEWWGGDVPWLALPDIRKLHGKLAYETTENTNDAGLQNSSARLLPVGTVCLCRDASIGFVTMLGRPMATSQHFCNWVCDPNRLDPEFLMYAFMASFDYLRELGSGSVLKTIYMPTIQSFHICAPAIDEQRRIAGRLRERLAAAEALSQRLRERQAEIAQLPRRLLAAAFEPVA